MNNFLNKLKQFFKNKNVVTVIGVVLIVLILFGGYQWQINQATAPERIPVATQNIQPRTEITKDMIEYVEIPKNAISENVVKNENLIIGKYSNINSVIPEGSMFYTDVLIEKKELPDIAFVKVKDGEIVYNFSVNMNSTYGNSIFPGNYIDIYMKAEENGKVMIGKLIENIEVLSVKDSSGQPVFESTTENRTPSMLIFGLPSEMYFIAKKASYMSGSPYNVELYPVPHGGSYTEEGATQVSTQYLKDYINANTINIPIDENNNNTDAGE